MQPTRRLIDHWHGLHRQHALHRQVERVPMVRRRGFNGYV
jgi:hypothetical protein